MKKKLISSVLALLLVCMTVFSAVSAAPAEWQPDKQISPVELNSELVYQVNLKANIGATNAATPVIVRVVKEADGFTGLSDSKVVYMDQAVADAYGNVSITFVVDQYGDFAANFRVMNGETSQAVLFSLLTKTEVEGIVSSAFAPSADTAQILSDNKEELNLDLTYFDKLKDDSAVLAELEANKASITPYNLAKILEEKTLLEYIKTSDDKLDISKALDRYEGKYLALGEQQWANIYDTYLAMNDTEKTAAMAYLQTYAPATIGEIADDFNQAVIFAAIKTMDKFDLDEVIGDNNDLLGLTGYEDLGTSQKTEFLGLLQAPTASLINLASVKSIYNTWKNPAPGPGAGGGGAISSPTYANPTVGATGAVGAFGADTDLVKDQFPETLDIATSFLDLKDVAWAETAIRYLALMEIVNGKGDRQFCPNDSVTREEFIKMIVGAFGLYDPTATCNFTDVPAEHWAHSYVASAVNSGLVFGVSNTEFGAGQNITREDMATLLYRMMVKLNTIERIKEFTYKFDDMDQVSTYAEYGVLMLYNGGYIQGSEGKFYPKNTATRAESAQMVYNIMTGNVNKPGQAEGGSAE